MQELREIKSLKQSFSEVMQEIEFDTASRNFLTLTFEEKKALTERIEKNDGTVLIYIHPFYFDYGKERKDRAKRPDHDLERYADIKNTITSNFARDAEQTPPMIIFEEKDYIMQTAQRLNQNNKNKSYLVPTYWGNPEPDFSDSLSTNHERDIEIDEEKINWQKLIDLLKQLKVSKVIVGGTSIEIEPGINADPGTQSFKNQRMRKGAVNVNYNLSGCVGGALHYLSHDFDVEISDKIFPASKDLLMQIEKMEKGFDS